MRIPGSIQSKTLLVLIVLLRFRKMRIYIGKDNCVSSVRVSHARLYFVVLTVSLLRKTQADNVPLGLVTTLIVTPSSLYYCCRSLHTEDTNVFP